MRVLTHLKPSPYCTLFGKYKSDLCV